MKKEVRFKSLPIGARFTREGQNFRKASKSGAYAINANGTGRTHEQIPFARNSFVRPL